MTTLADLAGWLETFAPSSLAESWDNVGLLLGDPASTIERVMTCLTVTPATATEAIKAQVDAIVSHHPILFRPAKSIRADRSENAEVWRLARAGIAILSPHTSFDNTQGGINDLLAARLGLSETVVLRPGASTLQVAEFKLVVFVPRTDREAVLKAAFEAGAGRIGDYAECSFSSAGLGTFHGLEGSNPTVGKAGEREVCREWKVEIICPVSRLGAVLDAVRQAHSYEEPAIDVLTLTESRPVKTGAGRVGRLLPAARLSDFAESVGQCLGSTTVQFVGDPEREVRRVAICCGAGDDFLADARRAKADVLVTGEGRFHRALEAEATGIGLILAGHHATERIGVEALAEWIGNAFPALQVWPSHDESDPLRNVPMS